MAAGEIDEGVFAVVSATAELLRAFYAELPAGVLNDAVDAGWSPLHVLGHLLDTEDVIVGRMRRIVEEERPFIRSIDAPARLIESGYLQRDVEILLRDFAKRRAEGIAWLRSMSPAQLARLGEHDEVGEISAADHAHQWAFHDLMHLKQAATMLQTRLERGMGNTHRFYFDV
jgi:hypothetical protein